MEQYIEFFGNHPVLFAALIGVIVFILVNEVRLRKGDKSVTALEAVRMINDQDAIIIDLRDPGDYKAGHALNARNIPLTRLGEQADKITSKKAQPIIVYCKTGTQSVSARQTLENAGYAQVYSLKGGLYGWQESNMPMQS